MLTGRRASISKDYLGTKLSLITEFLLQIPMFYNSHLNQEIAGVHRPTGWIFSGEKQKE